VSGQQRIDPELCVCSGVKAPRAARAGEKGEPYGTEGQKWINTRYMQRDVEISESGVVVDSKRSSILKTLVSITAFDSTDKQGGFIGTMYSNGQNVAVELLREGWVTILRCFDAQRTKCSRQGRLFHSLASTHEYSAANLSYAKELYDAEAGAKKEKKNVGHAVRDDYPWLTLIPAL
jgi:staphylococcal nuclease domain-containing protein 1